MAQERLDKHDAIHHQLFDEDTNQVGSLGEIVEKHAGDAVFLTPAEKSVGGADGGEADFEAEMLEADPDPEAEMLEADPDPEAGDDDNDLYSADDERNVFGTDQTGTVEGIARGFGTHLPQDIGADGFQVETIPDSALNLRGRPLADGEELDDYDDDTSGSLDDAKGKLAHDSEPFTHMVSTSEDDDTEPTPDRIPIRSPHADTADDALDATRKMK